MPIETEQNWEAGIAEDWKAIQAKHEAPTDEPAKTVDDVDVPKDEAPAESVAQDRARDEQGRFAKAEAAKTPVAAAPDKAAPAQEEAAAPILPGIDLNRAPSTWKPAAKAQWANLTPEIRAEIYRREQDFLKGAGELRPDADLGRNIRQVIEPYRMLIQAEGGTPETAISGLLRTAAIFRVGTPDQKQAALAQIAKQYGVPMPSAAIGGEQPPQQPQQPQEFRDPRLDQWLAQQQQQQTTEINTAVAAWSAETDAQGQPLRPFVDNVFYEMEALIPQIQQSSPGLSHKEVLQQAYDRATWANPEVRAVLMQQAEAKRREETLRVTAEAKKASSVNLPRRGALPAQAPVGSMEETIRETARNLGLVN